MRKADREYSTGRRRGRFGWLVHHSLWRLAAVCIGGIMAYTYRCWKGKERKGRTGIQTRDIQTLQEYIQTVYGSPETSAHFLHQVELVRRSWSLLKPLKTEAIAHEMYERLLENDVDAASVFRDNLDWRRQQRIFILMLSQLVDHLHDSEWVQVNLTRLGMMHHNLGVKPQYYQSMQRAIMTSLQPQLSHEWTQEYEDAWNEVWAFVSNVMIRGACQGKISRGPRNGVAASQWCASDMKADVSHSSVTRSGGS